MLCHLFQAQDFLRGDEMGVHQLGAPGLQGEHTAQRLTSPIVSTHLNTRNIAFERNKSGIWGWHSEKSEAVSGYEAKIYSATNVELVTRSRTEHLSDQDKSKSKGTKTPLQSFLGIAEQHTAHNGSNVSQCHTYHLTSWPSPIPILPKLRDFITLSLPPGFPVKIEIPLLHVLNARVTFSNLCGCDEPVSSVTLHTPEEDPEAGQAPPPFHCEVDPTVFEPPLDYTTLGPGRSEPMRDEDDHLLQFAIQQSLWTAGTESDQVTIWEALTNSRPVSGHIPSPLYEDDSQLERAIQESLSISLAGGEEGEPADPAPPLSVSPSHPGAYSPPSYSSVAKPRVALVPFSVANSFDEQLRIAMELSW
ncbi:hypothetical protein J4Q44_G00304470 [Coregonus suidteri]|uniref:Ankyrin repeat domain-containing protein n=1 Tax=Coregonus suidteri TaxID=861788 RepID=A0AAN8KU95_9TELE